MITKTKKLFCHVRAIALGTIAMYAAYILLMALWFCIELQPQWAYAVLTRFSHFVPVGLPIATIAAVIIALVVNIFSANRFPRPGLYFVTVGLCVIGVSLWYFRGMGDHWFWPILAQTFIPFIGAGLVGTWIIERITRSIRR